MSKYGNYKIMHLLSTLAIGLPLCVHTARLLWLIHDCPVELISFISSSSSVLPFHIRLSGPAVFFGLHQVGYLATSALFNASNRHWIPVRHLQLTAPEGVSVTPFPAYSCLGRWIYLFR